MCAVFSFGFHPCACMGNRIKWFHTKMLRRMKYEAEPSHGRIYRCIAGGAFAAAISEPVSLRGENKISECGGSASIGDYETLIHTAHEIVCICYVLLGCSVSCLGMGTDTEIDTLIAALNNWNEKNSQ